MPAHLNGDGVATRVRDALGLAPGVGSIVTVMPRVEGMNMGVWLGFKHVTYALEEAVLRYLAERGAGVREVYWRDGLCLQVVGSRVRYLNAVMIDEVMHISIVPEAPDGPTQTFKVAGFSERLFGGLTPLARGQLECQWLDARGRPAARPPIHIHGDGER